MLAQVEGSTLEAEIEALLDRQRTALRRLWLTSFLVMLALMLAIPLLLGLGVIGWGGVAVASLVGFLVLQGAVAEYRAAHEAVVRRVARR